MRHFAVRIAQRQIFAMIPLHKAQNTKTNRDNPMTFSDAVRTCMREKYATFQGRAPRSEYWWFYLFFIIVLIVVGGVFAGIAGAMGAFDDPNGPGLGVILLGIIAAIIYIAMLIPFFAVSVRRFHDYNLSGWVFLALILCGLIPVVGFAASIANIVITVLKGTAGPNKFGPDPLGAGDAQIFE